MTSSSKLMPTAVKPTTVPEKWISVMSIPGDHNVEMTWYISGEGSESEEEGTRATPVPRQKPGSGAAASKVQKYQEVELA